MAEAAEKAADPGKRIYVELADGPEAVQEAQQLRYRIFAEELGADVHSQQEGVDSDDYDPYCIHMLVRDRDSGSVIGCTRLLDGTRAAEASGFYSQGEFHMENIRRLPGHVLEVGRTCVHPDYRNGSTIGVLWSGLAEFIIDNRVDYLFGCASISLEDGGVQAEAIMQKLRQKYMAPDNLQVQPKLAVPAPEGDVNVLPKMPPLLKAYLSLGARVCGEPCWDPDFRVADVLILVDVSSSSARYVRHFVTNKGRVLVQKTASYG